MNQTVLSGKNGLRAQQQRMDNLSHNIANVNTFGYKSIRTDFSDLIYRAMKRPVQPQDGVNQDRGHGVLAATSTRILAQGYVEETGEALDFCIEGDGYFAVMDPQGNTRYTRDGAFFISREATGNFLVTSSGMYVLDVNGQKIQLPQNAADITVDQTGQIFNNGYNDDGSQRIARFGLYTFPNTEGLLADTNNTFTISDSSGGPMASDALIHQGCLEGSNVNLGQEMTYMIRAQRAFQAASRAITTGDSMDGIANSMKV